MKQLRKSYYNVKWHEFSKRVKERDNFQCLKCGRKQNQVVLQVHHEKYIHGLEPWEYALSDCITLCKGCHANEHNLIEPSKGWTLIAVIDLGGLYGFCERKGCGTEIRYEHVAYHPGWGYKNVGSSCIEFLTEGDKKLSSKILKLYKSISNFVHQSDWKIGYTKKGKEYIVTTYKHHIIRIYGKDKRYAFQIAIKEKGEKWFDWKDIISVWNKDLNQVKELAYIVARGLTAEDQSEIEILRSVYQGIK